MRNNSISSAPAAAGGGEGGGAAEVAKGGGAGSERDREKLREAKAPLGREASANSSSSSLAATNSAATTALGPAVSAPSVPGVEGTLRDGDARASAKDPLPSGPEAAWNGFHNHSRPHKGAVSGHDEQAPAGAAADAAAPAPAGKRERASERPPHPPSHLRGEKDAKDGPAENRDTDAAEGVPERVKVGKKDLERKQAVPPSEHVNPAAQSSQQGQGEASERGPLAGPAPKRVERRMEPERSTGSSSSGSGLPPGLGRGRRSLSANQMGGSSEDLPSLHVARSGSGTGAPAKTGKRGSRGSEAKEAEPEEDDEDARTDGKKHGRKDAEPTEEAEAEDTEHGDEEEEAAEEEEKKVVRREPTRRRQPGGEPYKGRRGAHPQSDDKDSGKEKEKEPREDSHVGSHRSRHHAAQQGAAGHHHLRRHHHSERQGEKEKEPAGHHRHEPEMASRRSQRHHEDDSKEPGDSPYRRSHHHHHPHGRAAPEKAEKAGEKAETEQEKAAAQHEKEHHEMRQFLGNSELVELPKFLLSLSRNEKEDDMMKIKGTKLPQRPKKRAKAVEKCVQRLLPGAWLVNVTRERYEVRERKVSSKKKPRGLKAMGGADSDSE